MHISSQERCGGYLANTPLLRSLMWDYTLNSACTEQARSHCTYLTDSRVAHLASTITPLVPCNKLAVHTSFSNSMLWLASAHAQELPMR